tara:strand:+ start:215 stop:472 length:258 start_codon:yes stop_codon:yes gene_type:complete
MLRFLIVLAIVVCVGFTFVGSRHFCDCVNNKKTIYGIHNVGWEAVTRISNLNITVDKKDHIFQCCKRVCAYKLPVVNFITGKIDE